MYLLTEWEGLTGKYLALGAFSGFARANTYGPHTGIFPLNSFAMKALAGPYEPYDKIIS